MRTRGGAAAAASALLRVPGPPSAARAAEYLEPVVRRHARVLSPRDCERLIGLGEQSGFLVEKESIDAVEQNDPNERFVPSQTIDVYAKGWAEPGVPEPEAGHVVKIEHEPIWELLRPAIPRITEIVKAGRDEEAFGEFYPDDPYREPELNWVFFRKYSPDDARNSLKQHVDTNMNTVNVELNDDYEGGGLFYIKPLASTGEIADEYYEGGYGWIDTIRRENTSDIVFPDLRAGDAIFYNYTVRHGVAPVESGTRYSMAFFFDMDNPAVQLDPGDEADSAEVSENSATWEDFNDGKKVNSEDEESFEVKLHNGLPDVELDLVLAYDAARGKEVRDMLFDRVIPDETTSYHAYGGDVIVALAAGTDEVMSEIKIRRDRPLYDVSEMTTILSSEL